MSGAGHDPIQVRVIGGALSAICEEMQALLVRAAYSANIKERRDCSTGVFDARGEMIMQGEAIPVHLGAMPESVAAVLDAEHHPGDAWVLNDPYSGGTHLPDITVIVPVFDVGVLIGFVCSRAHHADIGGPTPAGMPVDSATLADEGVVIAPTRLAHAGRPDDELLADLTGRMREPRRRLADLHAQLAACRLGERRLAALATRYGHAELAGATAAVLDHAERLTRNRIAALPDGSYAATDRLEPAPTARRSSDLALRLVATVSGDEITLNFAGSADQHLGNLNCPLAVTRSACYFAVRVLAAPDAPYCAGAYRPIHVLAPAGSVLNARPPAAVAAGNVETSSRVADLVLAAFGRAQGQGTMNNLTLAGRRDGGGGADGGEFTYYETIGGGQGACPDADGPSAVHVGTSNTLNTPVEALELELPVRVTEYSVRRGSGGDGRFRGGDGVIREFEALAPLRYSLIAERRRYRPRGVAGGEDGRTGVDHQDGARIPGKSAGELAPGRRLRIETPGGGGHGARASD